MKTLVVFPNREVLYAASTLGGEVTALAVSQEELETAVGRAHKVVQLHGEPYLDAVTEVVYRMASGHDVVILPSTKNAKTVGSRGSTHRRRVFNRRIGVFNKWESFKSREICLWQ